MTDRIAPVLTAIIALALLPATSGAETYRWIDDQGNVTYSDRPPQSREIGAPETQPAPERKVLETRTPGSEAPASQAKTPEAKTPDPRAMEPKSPEVKTPEPPPKARDAKATVPPAPVPRSGPTKVDELLELSGARIQLAGLLSRVAGDLRPPPGQMSAADTATIERILAQSLRLEAVYGALRDAFRPQVDRPNLEAAAGWLRTPVARKIIALEITSSEPSADQKLADYAANVKANPPPARRLELLHRLDWVTGANETSADLVAAIARGLASAVSAAGPPEARLRPGQLDDRAAQVRARTYESLHEVHTMSMLYTYQTLDDDELAEYVRFSSSDAGRWYNTAMRKALVGSIGKAVEQAAAELVRAVPLERWARAAMPAPQPVK
jgi:Domain of unknown function (DUF4124)